MVPSSGDAADAGEFSLVDVRPLAEIGCTRQSTGFWEQRAFFDVNETLLRAMGGTYTDPPPRTRMVGGTRARAAQAAHAGTRSRNGVSRCVK
jgi:hypothetical protein